MKYDGYRLMVIREQDGVHLISRGGHDLTGHFPLIEAALKPDRSNAHRALPVDGIIDTAFAL